MRCAISLSSSTAKYSFQLVATSTSLLSRSESLFGLINIVPHFAHSQIETSQLQYLRDVKDIDDRNFQGVENI